MALIKPATVIADVHGPIGPLCFQRSPAGIRVNPRSYTPHPQTAAQAWHHYVIQQLALFWNTLAASTWQAWKDYAPPTSNGYKAYLQVNIYRLAASLFPLMDPPTDQPLPPAPRVAAVTAQAANNRILYSYRGGTGPLALDETILLAHVWPQRPPTQGTMRGTPALAVLAIGDSITSPPLPIEVTYPPGTLIPGHVIWTEQWYLSPLGRLSPKVAYKCVIT